MTAEQAMAVLMAYKFSKTKITPTPEEEEVAAELERNAELQKENE